MSPWQRIAEDRINDAIARGEFADAGELGKSIDLEGYFALPESERMGVKLLRDAGIVPTEVDLMREAERLERALAECADPAKRHELSDRLQTLRVSLAMMLERRRSQRGTGE
jgi:hypothetical protein